MENQKNKHLTYEQRSEIHRCLDCGMTFKAIAARIGKDPTTISKEVRKHLSFEESNVIHRDGNGQVLPPPVCPRLLKTPFVCNPCESKRRNCPFRKQKYNAKLAQREYETLLVQAREGVALNRVSFYEADRAITAGIRSGQHLYHILQCNDLRMSKTSAYRHLHKGNLSIAAIDMPRVVKFKPRKTLPSLYVPKAAKIGRTYADFLACIEENQISAWVEMDTVLGTIGGKLILTLHFTFCNFMAGILLSNRTAAETAEKILMLKKCFADEGMRFGDIIPFLLTDNGGEFADVFAFENDLTGTKETALFFCDPMQSCQKPKVEKNHTMFRDIVPKGHSFDSFTQETVNLIFSHVNSVKRKSLNGKTPFEVFAFAYSEQVAKLFGIRPIPAEAVCQSPKLLKQ